VFDGGAAFEMLYDVVALSGMIGFSRFINIQRRDAERSRTRVRNLLSFCAIVSRYPCARRGESLTSTFQRGII